MKNEIQHLSHNDVLSLASKTAADIRAAFSANVPTEAWKKVSIYPVPRGGVPAAYAVLAADQLNLIELAYSPETADCFVDDIIDSGATVRHWADKYPGKPFFALIDKTDPEAAFREDWITFPWENQARSDDDTIVGTITNRIRRADKPFFANDNISEFVNEVELDLLQKELGRRAEHFLRGLVIDLDNDHNTKDTAARVAKMYVREVFKGRYVPAPKLTEFPNAKGLDEMYVTGPITIRSACSHHFVPIVGRCWIGIIPGDKVFGLSKFNRVVEWIASRPQIQEELVVQIADFIEQEIAPKGLAVVLEGTHLCMTWRGVKEPMDAVMKNSVMRGRFRENDATRMEFLSLIKG